MRGDKGFSLIELLIVLLILSLLASVLWPVIRKARARAYDMSAVSTLREAAALQTIYAMDHGRYAAGPRPLLALGLRLPAGVELRVLEGGPHYCMSARHRAGQFWFLISDRFGLARLSGPAPVGCP